MPSGGWIEVGKDDCDYCGGTGVHPAHNDLIGRGYTRSELIDRGYECPDCRGSGQRSVGYMDLRDESGR